MKNTLVLVLLLCQAYGYSQELEKDEKGRPYFKMGAEPEYVMTQYYLVLLKAGPNREQSKAVADSIQAGHMAHINRMDEAGVLEAAGPMGGRSDLKGIFVLSLPNKEEAERWVNQDPAIQSGRLVAEIHPWWAARGTCLD